MIRRTTASAFASYTGPAAAAAADIAWTWRELVEARAPCAQVGARERSRNNCLRKAGEVAKAGSPAGKAAGGGVTRAGEADGGGVARAGETRTGWWGFF